MTGRQNDPWTDREVAILRRLRAEGATPLQVRERLGRSQSAIRAKARSEKIPLVRGEPMSQHRQGDRQAPTAGKVTLPPLASLSKEP